MHSNGSSLASQVGDNTYDTTVERLKYLWLNAAYLNFLKARCSDRCISFFLQQMSSVSLTSTALAIRGYADDMQIYDHCVVDDMHHLTSRLVDCIGSIWVWMTNNRLKLNSSKTEFIWFGSARRLAQVYVRVDRDQRVLHSSIQDSPQPRIRPGSIFESGISRHQADKYILLSHTSAASTNDACHALVRALVISRLVYCHGLLAKAPDYRLAQLSGVMRAAARLILQLPRKSHVSDANRGQLHWLDISERVRFKLCVLARRCIDGSAPSYLSKYCIPVSSIAGRSHLRSAASGDLFIPATTNTVTISPSDNCGCLSCAMEQASARTP